MNTQTINPAAYIATTNPTKITEGGRHFGRLGRYAVMAQPAGASPVAFKEVQDPETGDWVRQPGGSVCEILVSSIMQASN